VKRVRRKRRARKIRRQIEAPEKGAQPDPGQVRPRLTARDLLLTLGRPSVADHIGLLVFFLVDFFIVCAERPVVTLAFTLPGFDGAIEPLCPPFFSMLVDGLFSGACAKALDKGAAKIKPETAVIRISFKTVLPTTDRPTTATP
jgi:hypothetical protein